MPRPKWFFALLLLLALQAPLFAATAEEFYKYGQYLVQQNQSEKAIPYFKAAVRADATDWKAYQALSQACTKTGDQDGALEAAKASLNLHPDNPELAALVQNLGNRPFPTQSSTASPSLTGTPTASGTVQASTSPASVTRDIPPLPGSSNAGSKKKWFKLSFPAGIVVAGQDFTSSGANPSPGVTQQSTRSSKTGLFYGFAFTFGSDSPIAFQPELLFVTKGQSFQEDVTYQEPLYTETIHYEGTDSIQYVEAPVLLKVYIGKNRGFNLVAGPYFAVKTVATEWYSYSMTEGTYHQNGEAGSNLKQYIFDLDFGLAAGVGYDLPHWTFGLRYDLGLTNIWTAPPHYQGASLTVNNRAFFFMAGYRM